MCARGYGCVDATVAAALRRLRPGPPATCSPLLQPAAIVGYVAVVIADAAAAVATTVYPCGTATPFWPVSQGATTAAVSSARPSPAPPTRGGFFHPSMRRAGRSRRRRDGDTG